MKATRPGGKRPLGATPGPAFAATVPESPSTRRWRLAVDITQVISTAAAIGALVFAVQSINLANDSIKLSNDALERESLTYAFSFRSITNLTTASGQLCTNQWFVLTNTGRLPITVLSVEQYVRGSESVGWYEVPYAYVELAGQSSDASVEAAIVQSGPLHLDVGQAMILKITFEGNLVNSRPRLVVSSGQRYIPQDFSLEGDPDPNVSVPPVIMKLMDGMSELECDVSLTRSGPQDPPSPPKS